MTHPTDEIVDDDLDQLLDQALDEFETQKMAANKPLKTSAVAMDSIPMDKLAEHMESLLKDASSNVAPLDQQDEAAARMLMEEMMKAFGAQDPGFNASTSVPGSSSAKKDASFKTALEETMERLQSSSDKVEAEVNSGAGLADDPMLAQMMKELDQLGDGEGFQQMIDTMMQELMSKELMFEPLKDLADKYPKWLEENKSELTTDQYAQYETQLAYCKQIIALYEQDEDPAKRADVLKQVSTLMQKMQDCGSPPEAILKDLAPGLEFGEDGLPKLGEALGQGGDCSIM